METHCCLERTQSEVANKYDYIPLSQTNEVSIGRGNDVTVQILSKEDPLMLSRKHAIINYVKDTKKWFIVDNKSLNGIFVNHARISPLKPSEIKESDEIHFGMTSKANNATDFIFKFTKKQFTSAEVEKIYNRLSPGSKGSIGSKCSGDKRKWEPSKSDKCKKNDLESFTSNLPSTSGNVETYKKAKWRTEEETKQLEDEKKAAELKAKEAEKRLKEVTEMLLKEKETVKAQYQEEMKLKENKLMKELQVERERLELEKKEIEEQMKEKFHVEMKEKESDHLERLKTQHEELMNEKKKIQCKLQKEMEEKLCEKEQNIVQLQKDMQEKLDKEIQDKEHDMIEELKRQKENLLKEKASVEEQLKEEWQRKLEEKDHNLQTAQEEMRNDLEMKIKQKEEMMLKQLTSQKEQLLAEKKTVEESLQREMDRKLDKKNQDLQEKLEEEKQKLENVISRKQQEYETLQTELVKSRLDQETQQLNFELAKQETMEKVSDMMESELQCSICAELFIQATTLNCSHSFCHSCIMEWFKKKKECPCCRTSVTTYTRSIVLDNYIDRMVEALSEELKTRRAEIIKERKNRPEIAARSGTFLPSIVISDDSEEDEEEESEEVDSEAERHMDEWRSEYANDRRFNRDDEFETETSWMGRPIVADADGNFFDEESCSKCGRTDGAAPSGTFKQTIIIGDDEVDNWDEEEDDWDEDEEVDHYEDEDVDRVDIDHYRYEDHYTAWLNEGRWEEEYARDDDRFNSDDEFDVGRDWNADPIVSDINGLFYPTHSCDVCGRTDEAAPSGTFKQTIIISDDEVDDWDEEVDGEVNEEEYARDDDRFNNDDDYDVSTDWNGDPIVSDINGDFYPTHLCDRCDQTGHSEDYCPRTDRYDL